jgi:hypothetical protein
VHQGREGDFRCGDRAVGQSRESSRSTRVQIHECCKRSNGGSEPKVFNAVGRGNVGFCEAPCSSERVFIRDRIARKLSRSGEVCFKASRKTHLEKSRASSPTQSRISYSTGFACFLQCYYQSPYLRPVSASYSASSQKPITIPGGSRLAIILSTRSGVTVMRL